VKIEKAEGRRAGSGKEKGALSEKVYKQANLKGLQLEDLKSMAKGFYGIAQILQVLHIATNFQAGR